MNYVIYMKSFSRGVLEVWITTATCLNPTCWGHYRKVTQPWSRCCPTGAATFRSSAPCGLRGTPRSVCLHWCRVTMATASTDVIVTQERDVAPWLERSLMVRWVVGSILHGVDPLSCFSFQPVLHDCAILSVGWCI